MWLMNRLNTQLTLGLRFLAEFCLVVRNAVKAVEKIIDKT